MIGIGSKVVCVEDCTGETASGLTIGINPNGEPKKGEIFVVERIIVNEGDTTGFGLVLVGKPALWDDGFDVGWDAQKFRELEHEQMRSELEYLRSLPKPTEPAHF